MVEIPSDILASLAMDTMERAAFVFSETRDFVAAHDHEVLHASLELDGGWQGRLVLAASPRMAGIFAGNLLGIEPEAPHLHPHSRDALGEMLNMIAGALLDHLKAEGFACTIGTPVVSVRSVREHEDLCSSARAGAALVAEEEAIDVLVLSR